MAKKILKLKNLCALVLAIACVTAVGSGVKPVAETADVGKDIIISDDFGEKGKVSDFAGVYDYSNLCKDAGGNADWGLVPGASWGAATSAGKGYITFKAEADENYTLKDLKIDFSAFHGHKQLGEYFGRSKTDLVVYASENNADWTRVYDLALIKYSMWSAGNLYKNCAVDCSEVFDGAKTAYIKFELVHIDYSGLTPDHQKLGHVAQNEKITLQYLGVRLHEVSITARQVKIGSVPEKIVTEERKASGKVTIRKSN